MLLEKEMAGGEVGFVDGGEEGGSVLVKDGGSGTESSESGEVGDGVVGYGEDLEL